MKKSLLTVAALLSLAAVTHAQVDEKRHYIGFNAGVSIPLGDYGSNANIDKDGYASTGRTIGLDAAYFIHKNIGVGASFGASGHKIDAQEMITEVNKDIHASGWTGASELKFESGYLNSHLMIGPAFAVPFEKVTLDFRALVGSVSHTVPKMSYINTTDGETLTVKSKEVSESGLGFTVGAGTRINLSEKLAIRIAADYITASEIEITSNSTITAPGQTINSVSTDKVDVSYFNLGVGLVFQFGQ